MNEYQSIRYSVADNIATIALDRPEARNAFNASLREELLEAVLIANNDEDVRVVILSGNGKGFCAGADLMEKVGPDYCVQRQIEEEYKPILMAIVNSPKIYISAVNGAAAGAGSALAMVADFCVMADNAYIYQAFSVIGLIPDCGATWHLTRQLGPKRALEMILEGDKMSAQRCVELGLANRVAPADELMAVTRLWATSLAAKAPLALQYSKQVLTAASSMDFEQIVDLEGICQKVTISSEDHKEGAMAFFQKRAAVFTGR